MQIFLQLNGFQLMPICSHGYSQKQREDNVQIVMETGKVIAFSLFCVDFDRYDMGGEKTYSSGKRNFTRQDRHPWKQLPDLV